MQDAVTMLNCGWSAVFDAGPALIQQCLGISRLLGWLLLTLFEDSVSHMSGKPFQQKRNIYPMLV